MVQKTKELTSFQRTVAIITVVALMVYAGINVFLVVQAYTKLGDNITEFSDIITNWQTGAVTDIKVAKVCPEGFESAVRDRFWPGVDNGCHCGSNVTAARKKTYNITCDPFCASTCTADAIKINCVNVAGRGPQLLNSWSSVNSDKVQICVKRSQDSWASVAETSSGECPDGQKACGTGDNKFCTKESQCPITSIIVDNPSSSLTTTDMSNCQANIGGECRVLADSPSGTDRRRIQIKRDGNNLPLVEFTVNEHSMCKLKSKNNVTPGRRQFTLISDKITTCNAEGAMKWNLTSYNTEALLFQANDLDTYINTYLANYRETGMDGYYPTTRSGANYQWMLFTRTYIPFKPTCRSRMGTLISKKQFLHDMKTSQLALLIIGCVSSFALGLVLSCMELQNLRGVDLPCISGKGEEERQKLKRIKKFVNYFFKGVQIPFQVWAIVLAGGAKTLLTDLADEQCSNADTNETLSYLATTLTSTFTNNITALGMLAGTLLLDLILEVCKKKNKQNDAVTPEIGNASMAQTSRGDDTLKVSEVNENSFAFGRPIQPAQPTPQPAPGQQPTIVIQLSGGPQTQQLPQQQYPAQQYPAPQYAQQYPAPQQYPQQYPPQQAAPQQYPPQQYPPQQYPQQYPPQQYPQQQYPPRY